MWKTAIVLLTLVLLSTSAFAQSHVYPGKGSPKACTGCGGTLEGKPTYPFDSPIAAHTGRYVDSSSTLNVQNVGMRTVRADAVRINPSTDRIYIEMGETIGGYKLSTFFSDRLKQPLSLVSVMNTNNGTKYSRYGNPLEKVAKPDSFFYAESKGANWTIEFGDYQVYMEDHDADDRGYLYVGTQRFGWGITRDVGITNAQDMDYVIQVRHEGTKDTPEPHNAGIIPNKVISLKTGGKYYLVTLGSKSGLDGMTGIVWDVNNPRVPVKLRRLSDVSAFSWTKHDQSERVATIGTNGRLRIYSYAGYVGGSEPIEDYAPPAGMKFAEAGFDEGGRLWVALSGTSHSLWRVSPSGGSFSVQEFDNVLGAGFKPDMIAAGGGYVAVGGRSSEGGLTKPDVRLLKLEGGVPRLLDTDGFFRKFYYAPPTGFVAPTGYSTSTVDPYDLALFEYDGNTYLFYSATGLGDVYEIEGGESISATVVSGSFGTENPNARSTESGPFYGDILKFKATSNNTAANYDALWNFGNPESGVSNDRQSDLGETITHQFTGLTTTSKITAAKKVTVEASTDSSITDELTVELKVPKARIGVPGRAEALTAGGGAPIVLVPGDKFTDASDGVVEGHYAIWEIGNSRTAKLPNEALEVGPALGAQTVTLISTYGEYNAADLSTSPSGRFNAQVSNVAYTVRPFTASINAPTSNSTHFTFTASARATQNSSVLSASQWTVTWSLLAPGTNVPTTDAVPTQSSTVNVGTVPSFSIAKGDLATGNIVTLQISVAPTAVPSETYATLVTTREILVPNPKIDVSSGCAYAQEPCTLTASSLTGDTTDGWNLSWSVKLGTTVVKTGTGKSVTFTPTTAGSYVATVKETVFEKDATKNLNVAAQSCAPVAEEHQALPSALCNPCEAGQTIYFNPNFFGYQPQACDTITWVWGDGTPNGTGDQPSHTYATNKTYRATMTIKNTNPTSNTRSWNFDVRVGNTTEPPPPPVCNAPAGITFSWAGSKGCGPNKACEVGESVKFTARRSSGALKDCDQTMWTIDGNTVATTSPSHTFTQTGTKTVSVIVSNSEGSAPAVERTVSVVPATNGGGSCTGSVPAADLSITYYGPTSKCASGSSTPCRLNEAIQFFPAVFGYTIQSCDRFEWNFGDNGTSTLAEPTHTYTTERNTYRVTLKMYNTNAPAGVTVNVDVPFGTVQALPTPVLAFAGFPAKGAKNTPITFTVNSDISAAGWAWEIDGAIIQSEPGAIGNSNSITHTFTTAGSHTVKVSARNSKDTSSAPFSSTIGTIVIEDKPEFRYLLPVVAHAPGQNNSSWRTDVQIYNPDPNVSRTKPLVMTATLRNINRTIEMVDSTTIFQDFMTKFTSGNDAGPVIISTRADHAPQIWTRTYTQTDTGTFGQFIPAIRLDNVGSGGAASDGMYYLAGLRHDSRYRTNLGFVNPGTQTFSATIRVYDERRTPIAQIARELPPFQIVQFTLRDAVPNLPVDQPFSVEIQVPAGQWVVAYASYIDGVSNDPVFVQAVRDSELASMDFSRNVMPGVGHTGQWRSDVTIFNPDDRNGVTFDLVYFDNSGTKIAEAKSIALRPLEFLQYRDVLKQGVLGNVPDGFGILQVNTHAATIPNNRYPMTFTRTYYDQPGQGTYGQGISGFAAARANVKQNKPGLLGGVRSDANYYTNVGLTNLSSTAVTVTVSLLNPQTGAVARQQQYAMTPNQSIIAGFDFGGLTQGTLKIETNTGSVWAFASIIDRRTKDPEYVPATATQ